MVNEKTPADIKTWLELVLDSLDGAERRVLKDEESWEDTLIDENHRGRQEEKIAIARALISEGVSTEVIARATGIPEVDIETLRQA